GQRCREVHLVLGHVVGSRPLVGFFQVLDSPQTTEPLPLDYAALAKFGLNELRKCDDVTDYAVQFFKLMARRIAREEIERSPLRFVNRRRLNEFPPVL